MMNGGISWRLATSLIAMMQLRFGMQALSFKSRWSKTKRRENSLSCKLDSEYLMRKEISRMIKDEDL